jgi:hypothetical protein
MLEDPILGVELWRANTEGHLATNSLLF